MVSFFLKSHEEMFWQHIEKKISIMTAILCFVFIV